MNAWWIFVVWAVAALALLPLVASYSARQQDRLEQRLRHRLEAFHIFVDPKSARWLLIVLLALSLVAAVAVLGSLWMTPVIAGACIAAVFFVVRMRLNKRFKQIRYQLPGVIELVATSLRSGMSIRSALHQVSRQSPQPIAKELAVLERMQKIGIPLDVAITEWAKRVPLDEIQLLGFTISVSAASGGGLSDSLDRLAHTFRQRLILEEKVDALTAQGRLQSWGMVALPMLLAGTLTAMDPSSMAPLWRTGGGHLVLVAMAVLELLGLFWIRRLIRVPA
jgi:tight adherence protein B